MKKKVELAPHEVLKLKTLTEENKKLKVLYNKKLKEAARLNLILRQERAKLALLQREYAIQQQILESIFSEPEENVWDSELQNS